MKYIPVIPLREIVAGISILAVTSSLYAGASNKSGNPYGNGSFFPDTGSFSAIVRSTNAFLGLVQFSISASSSGSSTNSTNSANSSGVASIYANGESFSGTSVGVLSGNSISVVYNANYNTGGSNDTVNGQFLATLFNTYPTQSFSGNGGQATAIFPRTNATYVQQYQTMVSGSRLVD